MTALSARANRTHRSALKATTAAMLILMGVAPALSAEGGPDATISIGSLYEPQNLDNPAGAGQGINEAFNGNVYEALFRLNDDGTVSLHVFYKTGAFDLARCEFTDAAAGSEAARGKWCWPARVL